MGQRQAAPREVAGDLQRQSAGESLDIVAYMGQWYQIANIPQFYEQPPCDVCTKAQYTWTDPVIQVVNTAGTAQNAAKCQVHGEATIPDSAQQRHLAVKFDGVPNFGSGQYWIVMLSAIDVKTKQYTYSVVSNEAKTTLYILYREQTMPSALYSGILQALSQQGYPTGQLKPTVQTGCS